MCGIVGIKGQFEEEQLKAAQNRLKHRGPNTEGIFIEDNIGLAHTRLSIIDLSKEANQPMAINNCTIIFNGEIYNFKEIKADLREKGYSFSTRSDTEVILKAYIEYGPNCLGLFNGMFAFAIYDKNKGQLFLARDRLGIKPLYYYYKDNKFIFASELKAILEFGIPQDINKQALSLYFSDLCIPAPYTVFDNCHKLLPGHFLILKENQLNINQYWDLSYNEKINMGAEPLMIEKLKEAIEYRLIADVPLGAFLSGGIDSSLIVALMAQISTDVKTFSIGFENNEDNELKIAKTTAEYLNTDHHEYMVKPAEFNLFPKLVYHADEPFADDSIIPTYIISEIAKKKVAVCLSGDGGDENFGGYDRYVKNRYELLYSKIPINNERFQRIKTIAKVKDPIERFIKGNETFIEQEKKQLLGFNYNPKKIINTSRIHQPLNKLLYADLKTTLPNLFLKKVDTASMANALEVRVPFLDHNFVQFSACLPTKYKVRGITKKYLLKKAANKLLPKLPNKKTGFNAPIDNWLKGELKHDMKDIIDSISKRNLIKKEYVEKLWQQHQNNRFNHQQRLWSLVSLELWYRVYMDNIPYDKVLS